MTSTEVNSIFARSGTISVLSHLSIASGKTLTLLGTGLTSLGGALTVTGLATLNLGATITGGTTSVTTLTASTSTGSTSASTGAVQTPGGIGAGGNSWFGGTVTHVGLTTAAAITASGLISFTNTTSVSTTSNTPSGAVNLSGAIGFLSGNTAGNMQNVIMFNDTGSGYPVNASARSLGTRIVIDPKFSAGTFCDYAIGVGGNGINGMWYGTPGTTDSHQFYNNTTFSVGITATLTTFQAGNLVSITNNTASSSVSTGALVLTAGGLGVFGNAWIGGTLNAAGLATLTLGATITGGNTSVTTMTASGAISAAAGTNALTLTGPIDQGQFTQNLRSVTDPFSNILTTGLHGGSTNFSNAWIKGDTSTDNDSSSVTGSITFNAGAGTMSVLGVGSYANAVFANRFAAGRNKVISVDIVPTVTSASYPMINPRILSTANLFAVYFGVPRSLVTFTGTTTGDIYTGGTIPSYAATNSYSLCVKTYENMMYYHVIDNTNFAGRVIDNGTAISAAFSTAAGTANGVSSNTGTAKYSNFFAQSMDNFINVIAVGDSNTSGTGVASTGQDYVQMLNYNFRNKNVGVINKGFSGWTSYEFAPGGANDLATLIPLNFVQKATNIVTLLIGTNDVTGQQSHSYVLATTLANIAAIIATCKTLGCLVWVCTYPGRNDTGTVPGSMKGVMDVNNGIRNLNPPPDKIIDLYQMTVDPAYFDATNKIEQAIPAMLQGDNLHLSAAGHAVVANAITQAIYGEASLNLQSVTVNKTLAVNGNATFLSTTPIPTTSLTPSGAIKSAGGLAFTGTNAGTTTLQNAMMFAASGFAAPTTATGRTVGTRIVVNPTWVSTVSCDFAIGMASATSMFYGTSLTTDTHAFYNGVSLTMSMSNTLTTFGSANIVSITNTTGVPTTSATPSGALNVAGCLALTGGSGQACLMINGGQYGIPSSASRSIGTRIVLNPNTLGGSLYDYAIGINNSPIAMWFGVNDVTDHFQFYHRAAVTLDVTQALTTFGSLNLVSITNNTASSSVSTGALVLTAGGLGVFGNTWIGGTANVAGIATVSNATAVSSSSNTLTGAILSAGAIYLTGTGGTLKNVISFAADPGNLLGGPSYNNRYKGTRIIFYPAIGVSGCDFGLGIAQIDSNNGNVYGVSGVTDKHYFTHGVAATQAAVSFTVNHPTVYTPSTSNTVNGSLYCGGSIALFGTNPDTTHLQNVLMFNANGLAIPVVAARTVGTRLVIHPVIGASACDFAIGMASATSMFYGTSLTSDTHAFYNGVSLTMSMSNTLTSFGSLNLVSITNNTASTSVATGALVLTAGGLGVFGNANIGGFVTSPTVNNLNNNMLLFEDFTQTTLNTLTLSGNAFYSQNNWLRLTDGSLSVTGWATAQLDPGNCWTAQFQLFFSGGGDGVSFFVQQSSIPGGGLNNGGYAFVFADVSAVNRIYLLGPAQAGVASAGVQSAVFNTYFPAPNIWYTVTITYEQGKITMWIDGSSTTNAHNLVSGLTFSTYQATPTAAGTYMGFNASSTGTGESHYVRNIRVHRGTGTFEAQSTGAYPGGGNGSFTAPPGPAYFNGPIYSTGTGNGTGIIINTNSQIYSTGALGANSTLGLYSFGGFGITLASGGAATFNANVGSSSISTGTIITTGSGGLGLGGNAWIGGTANIAGITTISNSTNSSSKTTGALVLSNTTGGLGVGGNAWIGGTLNAAALATLTAGLTVTTVLTQLTAGLTVTGATTTVAALTASGLTTFTNTTDAALFNSASVTLSGGLGIAKGLFIGDGNASVLYATNIYSPVCITPDSVGVNPTAIADNGALLLVGNGGGLTVVSAGPVTATASIAFISGGVGLTFGSAKTITKASTLRIGGPPFAGTNMTFTNVYSLYVDSGDTYLGGRIRTVISATQSPTNCTQGSTASYTTNGSVGSFSVDCNGLGGGGTWNFTMINTTLLTTSIVVASSAHADFTVAVQAPALTLGRILFAVKNTGGAGSGPIAILFHIVS